MKLPGESDAVARWGQRNWDRNLRPPDIEQIINTLMHTEIALAAAEQRATESAALVREIAASDPVICAEAKYDSGDDFRACRYCLVHQVGTREIPHRSDCHWLRSRAIVARLDGGTG